MKGNDNMSKEEYVLRDEGIWFKELLVKIQTYDGMFYTIGKHSREDIEDAKKEFEECTTDKYEYDEVINTLITEDLMGLLSATPEHPVVVHANGDLIYLPYEHKLINRKDIKESLIQFN